MIRLTDARRVLGVFLASIAVAALGAGTASAETVAVSLPTWTNLYDWPQGQGYFGWDQRSQAADPLAYSFSRGLGATPGLWLWLTGDREYRPGTGEWVYQSPGTTRIASARFDVSYRDKLFAHHCLTLGLRAPGDDRAKQTTCAPPRPPATQARYDVGLADPSASPAAKQAFLRVEMPVCHNPADTPCSKWIPALDPVKNGPIARVNRIDMVLVDDDLPSVMASGPLYDVADKYVNGHDDYSVTVVADDAGAGIERLGLDHLGEREMGSAAAPCDRAHHTEALGGAICPPTFGDSMTIAVSSLPEGAQSFRASATDPARNVGHSGSWEVLVDRTGPSAPTNLSLDIDEETYGTTAWWSSGTDPALVDGRPGSGYGADEYRLRISGGDWSEWTRTIDEGVDLPDTHPGDSVELEVRTVDAVGNVSEVAATRLDVPSEDSAGAACDDPERPANFGSFTLGESFEGLPMTDNYRRCEPPSAATPPGSPRANFVTRIYGDCSLNDEEACQPPLEVQTWPACERDPASYKLGPGLGELPRTRLTVEGVPAALFDDGARLELYTGRSTVVLFGVDHAQMRRAASALVAASSGAFSDTMHLDPTVTGELSPPARGVMTGTLACRP